jgi:hypothetical protein
VRRAGLTLLVLAAVLAAGVATAQETVKPTFQKDGRGDAGGGPLDIVRVAVARTSDGKLRGELTMAADWNTAAVGTGGSLCLRVYARRSADADVPDHLVCATPGEGSDLTGRVLRDRANGLPIPTESATVSRPTRRTIYFRFSQTAIGKPARIRLSGETVTRGEGCPAPLGCRDLAPAAPGALTLRLRSPTDQR